MSLVIDVAQWVAIGALSVGLFTLWRRDRRRQVQLDRLAKRTGAHLTALQTLHRAEAGEPSRPPRQHLHRVVGIVAVAGALGSVLLLGQDAPGPTPPNAAAPTTPTTNPPRPTSTPAEDAPTASATPPPTPRQSGPAPATEDVAPVSYREPGVVDAPTTTPPAAPAALPAAEAPAEDTPPTEQPPADDPTPTPPTDDAPAPGEDEDEDPREDRPGRPVLAVHLGGLAVEALCTGRPGLLTLTS